MHRISALYTYPVKSLGGIKLTSALLTNRGLAYDRRWMLVDHNNRFLTQREHARMALLQTEIKDGRLVVFHKHDHTNNISVPLKPVPSQIVKVVVWEDDCAAHYVSDAADAWFSQQLDIDCRLVYMPQQTERKVDQRYAFNNELTGFSDDFPLLMIGDESLNDLNSRLASVLPMDRFRPNIVFSGGNAYDEDTMEHFVINDINFSAVKPCARCVITCTDQATGIKYKEPLATLAAYRLTGNKVLFGQNILFDKTGTLHTGDSISIKKIKTAPVFELPG